MEGLGKLCPVFTGTFGECSSEAEVQFWMRYNIFLLLEVGGVMEAATFSSLVMVPANLPVGQRQEYYFGVLSDP